MSERAAPWRLRRRPLVLALASAIFGSLALSAARADAFPAQIQTVTKVSVGKFPRLLIVAQERAEKAIVTLEREDGRTFTYPIGQLSPGLEKEILLDGSVGRHRYEGTMTAVVDEEEVSSRLSFETVVATPIQVHVKREDLDLEKGRLRVQTNRAVHSITVTIIGESGAAIQTHTHDVTDWKKDQPIALSWPTVDADRVVHIDLRVEDADGFFNAIRLTPWSVEIPHEEVLFASGSHAIEDDEVPKLEESLERVRAALKKYAQIGGVQLFIAGHTDTRGERSYNLNLSRRRAQSIAAWFAQNGLTIPIHFEGFGESSLKVKTRDEVDEPQNRRVDYILSVQPPNLHGSGSWRRLN